VERVGDGVRLWVLTTSIPSCDLPILLSKPPSRRVRHTWAGGPGGTFGNCVNATRGMAGKKMVGERWAVIEL
jgi:hypothetical protein